MAVLTFAGPEFVGGSLADGGYTLTVLADRVHDRWGRELDGDGDGSAGGDRADGFSRLFGDSDGDGDVDRRDRDRFGSAFGTGAADAGYLWYFDFDGDGDVDGRDNGQFNRRFRPGRGRRLNEAAGGWVGLAAWAPPARHLPDFRLQRTGVSIRDPGALSRCRHGAPEVIR